MAITNPPYAYDIVGSFLRPEALKQARADFACLLYTSPSPRD